MRWFRALADPWVWRFAFRDSRRARGRLFIFVLAMTVGVAALVAIGSFAVNLEVAVANESRSMLGADLRVSDRDPFSAETEALIRDRLIGELGGVESRQLSFASMAWFERAGRTRLVQVNALDGDYPFYGEIETDPPSAAREFRTGRFAVVDAALMTQFDVDVGDPIRVGSVDYAIAGALKRIPGESATAALLGPRVYVPLDGLDPDLMDKGSRIGYSSYFRLPASVDPDRLREELDEFADEQRLRIETVASREDRMQESVDDLAGFLNLVGFIALLLGGLGVGSAMHVHVRRKVDTVATLRCLGARAERTFAIYLAQAIVLGSVGAVLGAALGVAVQHVLPVVLKDVLPMEVDVFLAPLPVIVGMGTSLVVAIAFALLPLLPIRRIPPLAAIRAGYERETARRVDPARVVASILIVLGVFLFALAKSGELDAAAGYTAGLAAAYVLLVVTARLLRAAARRLFSRRFPYVWRQGLANLDRPQNQTALLMVSVGLGTFLVLTLFQTQRLLLGHLGSITSGEQPNLVLFDIQDDQLDAIRATVEREGFPVIESVPIVNMRVKELRGRPVDGFGGDDRRRVRRWALRREYRSTYRDHLTELETIEEGEWIGTAGDPGSPAPISVERRIAEDLDLALGDSIVWDVQGVPVETVVASVREVDWRRMRPNFFCVFPTGVLEAAPKFHVLVTRGETPAAIGGLQKELVQEFPNVSAIDVSLVLEVADELLARIGFVIQFMAFFSIATGLLVLVASILTTRFQRLEESALLRTLGATRRQVSHILNVEFLLLGALATLTGLALSIAGTWALVQYRFDVPFTVAWGPLAAAFVVVMGLTLGLGRLSSRGLNDAPPLEVLRAEG